MHIKDRKLWRARAEALAKEKKLIRVQVRQWAAATCRHVVTACGDYL